MDVSGTLIDRYQILSEIGRGGMARVYRARDLRHGRDVAFKLLRREFAGSTGAKRFAREIRIASELSHPNILPVLNAGEFHGIPFYVMELVEGPTLQERLRSEPRLTVEDAVRIAGEVAAALSSAHTKGVVHRDIKPSNILVADGHALVADFGIALHLDSGVSERLTDSGVTIGTAQYMSPEQGRRSHVDGRSDTYALGCVLYEMLTGHPPFSGHTPEMVIHRHEHDPIPVASAMRREVSRGLDAAITRALAKNPADRFDDPLDFKAALDAAGAAQAGGWLNAIRRFTGLRA